MDSSYPLNKRPLALAAGDTVQLLDLSVFVSVGGARQLQVHYSTNLAAADSVARAAQADRVAVVFGPQATQMKVERLVLAICDTEGCAAMRERPTLLLVYERGEAGAWQRTSR